MQAIAIPAARSRRQGLALAAAILVTVLPGAALADEAQSAIAAVEQAAPSPSAAAALESRKFRLFGSRKPRPPQVRDMTPQSLMPLPRPRADERLTAPLIMPVGKRPQPLLPRYGALPSSRTLA